MTDVSDPEEGPQCFTSTCEIVSKPLRAQERRCRTHSIVGKVLRAGRGGADGVAAEKDAVHKCQIERRVLCLPAKLPSIAAWRNKTE